MVTDVGVAESHRVDEAKCNRVHIQKLAGVKNKESTGSLVCMVLNNTKRPIITVLITRMVRR